MALPKDIALSARLREALVDQPDFLREIVQSTLQRLLEEEITLHLTGVRQRIGTFRVSLESGCVPDAVPGVGGAS